MELRHIRYFLSVAEHMSFTKASENLHIAQPPLSQQIKNLEQELGYDLFLRNKRNIQLTQAGRDFLEEARQLMQRFEQFERKVKAQKEGAEGTLNISIISSFASKSFAEMLKTFRKENPSANIMVTVHPSMWQQSALDSGKIDVGFLMLPSPYSFDSSSGSSLKKDAMKLAVPPQHPLAKKGKAEWSDLAEEPLILVEPEVTPAEYYSEFTRCCRRAGVEPSVSQYANNVATQIWMVSAGMGLAPIYIAPELEIRYDVKFIPLPANAPKFETFISWRKEDSSPLLAKFVRHAKNHFS